MTKRLGLSLLFALIVATPLRADFNSLARAVSSSPGVKRISIPFLGLARMAVWVASPEGVHDFQLATFEGGGLQDGKRFADLIERHAKGFTPLVQARQRNGEWAYVYVREGKNDRFELLVLAHDKDTVLVRVEVDADRLARSIHSPTSVISIARR